MSVIISFLNELKKTLQKNNSLYKTSDYYLFLQTCIDEKQNQNLLSVTPLFQISAKDEIKIIKESLHKNSQSKTLQNYLSLPSDESNCNLNLFLNFCEHNITFTSLFDLTALLNQINDFKCLVCISTSKEKKCVGKINEIVWTKLGFPIHKGDRPHKKLYVVYEEKVGQKYPIKLHEVKKLLEDRQRLQHLNSKNANISTVDAYELKNCVNSLWQFHSRLNLEQHAILIQICTGCRFSELSVSKFIPVSTTHAKTTQLYTLLKPKLQTIPNHIFFIAVFRLCKLDHQHICKNDNVASIIESLITNVPTTTTNVAQEITYWENFHTSWQNLGFSASQDYDIVQLIPCKPLLFVNDTSQYTKFWKSVDIIRKSKQLLRLSKVNEILCSVKDTKNNVCLFSRKSSLTTHKLRYIYANTSFQTFANTLLCTNNYWIMTVLGHKHDNLTTSLLYQTCKVVDKSEEQLKDRVHELEMTVCHMQEEIKHLRHLWAMQEKKRELTFFGAKNSMLIIEDSEYARLSREFHTHSLCFLLKYTSKQGFLANRKFLCEFFHVGNKRASCVIEDFVCKISREFQCRGEKELQKVLIDGFGIILTPTMLRLYFKSLKR